MAALRAQRGGSLQSHRAPRRPLFERPAYEAPLFQSLRGARWRFSCLLPLLLPLMGFTMDTMLRQRQKQRWNRELCSSNKAPSLRSKSSHRGGFEKRPTRPSSAPKRRGKRSKRATATRPSRRKESQKGQQIRDN
jgi:hypothetical protein